MLAYLESKTMLKPDCPEDPCWVFNEAQAVEYPDGLFFNITLCSKEINEQTKGVLVKGNSKGIDGEIAPVEIKFKRTVLYNRECGWCLVIFKAGCCDVDFKAIRVNNLCSCEFLMGSHLDAEILCKFLCKKKPVALNDNINIVILYTEQEVPHEPSN